MSLSEKRGVFGVVADPQSYLNILYLLLSFPLGTIYFVFLVTGLSLGFGMIITLFGIPILLLVLGGSLVLCDFERMVAIAMLKEQIPPASSQPTSGGWWPRLKACLLNRRTWTGVLYLLLKFPVGTATFTIAVTLVSVTGALLTAPIYYSFVDMNWSVWTIDTLWEASLLTLIGIPLLFISLHLMNGAAFVSGRLARAMLT
jgi:hypothetical protein